MQKFLTILLLMNTAQIFAREILLPGITEIIPNTAKAGSKVDLKIENVKFLKELKIYFRGPDYTLLKAINPKVVNANLLRITVPARVLTGLLVAEYQGKKFQSYNEFISLSNSKPSCSLTSTIKEESGKQISVVTLTTKGEVGNIRLNGKAVPLNKREFKFENPRFKNYYASVEGSGGISLCDYTADPLSSIESVTSKEEVVYKGVEYCGDGFVSESEECDEGNENGNDKSFCGRDCSFVELIDDALLKSGSVSAALQKH